MIECEPPTGRVAVPPFIYSPFPFKPCRFAAIVCDETNVWALQHVSLLDSITDGFPIVQGEVPEYAWLNYGSILEPSAREKMDKIVLRELEEGIIS